MPTLFYGSPGLGKRKLYGEHLSPIQGSVFNKYMMKKLGPNTRRPFIANHWHLRNFKLIHSALAWHNNAGKEQLVILPGELDWRETLLLAREFFKPVIPSAIVFRVNNTDGAYLYD
jgi:hypothetical protein